METTNKILENIITGLRFQFSFQKTEEQEQTKQLQKAKKKALTEILYEIGRVPKNKEIESQLLYLDYKHNTKQDNSLGYTLYTKQTKETDKFIATFDKHNFIVEGPYENETTAQNLDTINNLLEGNPLLKEIRKSPPLGRIGSLLTGNFTGILILGAGFCLNKFGITSTESLNQYFVPLTLGSFLGITALGTATSETIRRTSNKKTISQFSDSITHYNFGRTAQQIINTQYNSKKFKENQIAEQKFSHYKP